MPESFGARMRQRREERGIDLIAIAEQTKIKLALLEALERDDVSHWPSGIFRRAYIRTYAQFIGLDPDVVHQRDQRVEDLGDPAAERGGGQVEHAKTLEALRELANLLDEGSSDQVGVVGEALVAHRNRRQHARQTIQSR